MDKFIKIPVGSGTRNIVISNVTTIVRTSATVTSITYVDGGGTDLTHTSATGNEQVVALQAILAKALATSWDKPVYDATGAVDALPQAVSAIA